MPDGVLPLKSGMVCFQNSDLSMVSFCHSPNTWVEAQSLSPRGLLACPFTQSRRLSEHLCWLGLPCASHAL